MVTKLPTVGPSIFSYMTKLAAEHNAINLAQGFPDFPCSSALMELVNLYMQKGHNQYAPTYGIVQLREAIAIKCGELYNIKRDPESEITITSGATEAIYLALTSLIKPGDEVIIFEPAFDSYTPVVELNGGICRYVELSYPDFSIDWDKVKAQLSPKTKAILINSPHNPTGRVIGKRDVEELVKIAETNNLYVISDEVYEHIIFDGLKHFSLLEAESIREKTIIISSFGKTFHTTGWRIGYCIASEAVSNEIRKVHQFTTFAATTPMQYATADFLAKKENYINLPSFYQDKRDEFSNLLQSSRFKLLPCLGTYFQLLNFENLSDKPDRELALQLTKETGVASIPLSVFYHDKKDHKVLRFCFAKKDSTIESAATRLCKI